MSLVIVTFVATAPISGAEIASPANIGSVSAIGSVQLRGIGISEGTLFSGDRLNVAPGGYAKVVLGAGPKVEVGGSSDVTVSRDADAISIQMTSGNIAFSGNGQKPVRVRIGAYEVTAAGQSKGSVAFIGSGAFGIRVLDGTVNVRNTSTKQSFTVGKGSERLISLGEPGESGALLASTAPTSIPAAPRMPAARGLSGGVKTALVVGSLLGSAAAIALLMTKNDDSDSEAANRLAKIQTLSNVGAIATTAGQSAQAASTVSTTASAALNVINTNTTIGANAANKAALLASANALIVKANNALSAITSLQAQINALEAQIEAFGTVTPAQQTQLNSLLAQVEAQRLIVNSAIADLTALINAVNTAAGANVLNNPGLQPIPPAALASPSNP